MSRKSLVAISRRWRQCAVPASADTSSQYATPRQFANAGLLSPSGIAARRVTPDPYVRIVGPALREPRVGSSATTRLNGRAKDQADRRHRFGQQDWVRPAPSRSRVVERRSVAASSPVRYCHATSSPPTLSALICFERGILTVHPDRRRNELHSASSGRGMRHDEQIARRRHGSRAVIIMGSVHYSRRREHTRSSQRGSPESRGKP